MTGSIARFKFRLHDWLYYSRIPREASGLLAHLRSRLPGDPTTRLQHTIASYRFSRIKPIQDYALEELQESMESPTWRAEQVGWDRYQEQLTDPKLSRTVVLKAPGANGEKGVILITFEYNWLRLLAGVPDLSALERDYDLIFSTSSSPTNYQMLALAISSLRGPVYVQACNYDEIQEIEAVHPRLRCLPMLPCDWLEPSLFSPREFADRDIDVLMIANWDLVKRQWHFFEALKSMDPTLRIVMVGQKAGKFDLEFAKTTARLFGAPQQIEFHQSLSIEEVAELQCRSKISTIFSRREGCCVAVTESLFANSPVALLKDAHIGPKSYINSKTGVLLDRRRNVGHQLQAFLERAHEFDARAWALENISTEASTKKLNEFLRAQAEKEGRPWTTDLLAPCWRAHPTLKYNAKAETMRPTYEELHQAYPEVFPEDLMQNSYR